MTTHQGCSQTYGGPDYREDLTVWGRGGGGTREVSQRVSAIVHGGIITKKADGNSTIRKTSSALPEDVLQLKKRLKQIETDLKKKIALIASLEESQEQCKDLLDLCPDAVVILQDGIFQYVSRSFHSIFGFSVKDIERGLSIVDLVQEKGRENVLARYKDRLQEKDLPTMFQLDLVAKDGSIVPCETSSSMIPYQGRAADLVIIRNISERVERQMEVRNLKELSSMLISTSPEAITVTDLQGNLVFISSLTMSLYGVDHENELIGRNVLEFIAPEDHEKAIENTRLTLERGSVRNIEYNMTRKDGSRFVGELNATLIKNPDDEPVGFIATTQDISDRIQARMELMKSEEQYRTLAESIQDGIYTLNSEGRFTYVNDVVVQRSGKPREFLIGKRYLDILPEEHVETIKDQFEAAMKGHEIQRSELKFPSATGKILWMEVTTTPLHQEGKVVGVFGLSRDITERKKIETLQKIMLEITNATNTSDSPSELYQSIQTNLGKVMDTTNFYIALYDQRTDLITLPYFVDEKDEFTELPAGKTFTSYVIRNDKPVLLNENDIERLVASGDIEELGSRPKLWLGVPFKDGNEVIGAVVVQSYSHDSLYTEEDFEVLKFVSDNISFAIKRKQTEMALRASEEKYRALFHHSNDAIFIHDTEQNILDANKRAQDLMGYSKDELLRMKVFELHPEGEILKTSQAFEDIQKMGYVNLKIDFKKKNGEIFTADLSSGIYKIGKQTLIQGIVRDITEQEKAAKALRVSEEKFRTFAERSPNMIFINKEGKLPYVNEKCTEIMGYARDEFYSPDFDFWSLIHKNSLQTIREKLELHAQGKDVTPYEYQIVTKVGAVLDAINNSRVIEYEGGPAILGIITDITEMKKTEAKLKRTQERFRKVFESTREGIIVSNPQGIIVAANPGAATMLGYKNPNEIIGLPEVRFFAKPEIRDSLVQDLKEKESLQDIELQFIKQDGSIIHVLSTASTHLDVDGSVTNQQIIFMDITERKQAEEEMKRRLMKFRLDSGNIYLVKESSPNLSLEAFKDLQEVGYQGIVISRTSREDFTKVLGQDFEYYWLAEKKTDDSVKPTIAEITRKFEDLGRHHVVFLDRLDYLISKVSFKKTLSLIHHLRELIFLKGAIVIISLDQYLLRPENLRQLEKECRNVEPLHKKIISDDLFTILKFVYRQNTHGIKPSYSSLGKELNISKPTVRKRIGDLLATGYLREDTKGRNKAVELTERSRQLFWK